MKFFTSSQQKEKQKTIGLLKRECERCSSCKFYAKVLDAARNEHSDICTLKKKNSVLGQTEFHSGCDSWFARSVTAQGSIKCSDGNVLVVEVDVTHIAEQKVIPFEIVKTGRDLQSDIDGTIKYNAKLTLESQ